MESKPLTTRQLLAAHQEQPQCAQCHRKIDPVGFALENYDAAGRWRTHDTRPGVPADRRLIDSAGAFHDGPSFKSFTDFRDVVATQQDRFARGFTEALIEYGLGRQFGFSDDALAMTILDRAKQRDYDIREFIYALVASTEFQSK
jgi:hypothetical protein